MNWVMRSPRNLRLAVIGIGTAIVVGFILAATIRLHGVGAVPVSPTPSASPSGTDYSSLIAPTTPSASPSPGETEPATDEFGDPTPIMLEAIQAFLDHDTAKFATLASPEVAELVHGAPAPRPGQTINTVPEVLEPGPTQRTYKVSTTDAPMIVTMAVDQSRSPAGWIVTDLAYEQ